MGTIINQFWIAANVIFNTQTGATDQVLMLVNRATDATIFTTQAEAENYYRFVAVRAPNISWTLEAPIPQRPQGWVIRGQQLVQTSVVPPFHHGPVG